MNLKSALSNLHKGNATMTEYMHGVKSIVDNLTLMNAAPDPDELVLHIPHGLRSEYNRLSDVVRARETFITFDELHKKLITRESQLQSVPSQSFLQLVSANHGTRATNYSWPPGPPQGAPRLNTNQQRNSNRNCNSNNSYTPCLYLGPLACPPVVRTPLSPTVHTGTDLPALALTHSTASSSPSPSNNHSSAPGPTLSASSIPPPDPRSLLLRMPPYSLPRPLSLTTCIVLATSPSSLIPPLLFLTPSKIYLK
ncbi:hypothetical protein Pfo_010285 [Paulownia fortunei]|nr:hypothetical protein Pfo_010285 [Paulownia fortunei]